MTALAAAGCGGGQRQDANDGGRGPYVIDLERAQFPARQRLARRCTFVITVRNAGEATIPNLAVTLRGFTRRTSSPRATTPSVSLWTIDRSPHGRNTAIEDTWAAGALAPGKRASLRWQVTPIVAGTHVLSYSIASSLQGSGRMQRAGGGAPRGALTVRVDGKPPSTRVDPQSGRVVRDE